ncbi:UNVERIFIED_CONTAM: hypothetical protein RMT77_011161 [Armadillidium vulgare]|nr:Transmembrane protein [Armadillidium vulgare]
MSSLPIETEYEPLADRPLFGVGETRPRDRTINIIIVVVTCFIVLFTTVSAFVPYPSLTEIFFVLCIIMICSSHLVLIFWYRQGDIDPKFKKLIYYNAINIILLCICANLFFHSG